MCPLYHTPRTLPRRMVLSRVSQLLPNAGRPARPHRSDVAALHRGRRRRQRRDRGAPAPPSAHAVYRPLVGGGHPVANGNAMTFLAEINVKLGRLCDERGRVPPGVGESLIASSAFWVSHPSGPCHAPGHAKHVTESRRALKIKFGSNTFNISSAVQRCCETMKQAATKWAKGQPLSRNVLDEKLRENLQRSVEGRHGSEYRHYPIDEDQLVFGATAIDAGAFLAKLLEGIPIAQICAARPPTPLSRPMKTCPHCGVAVRVERFENHVASKCPKRR